MWSTTYNGGRPAFQSLIESVKGFAHQSMGASLVEQCIIQNYGSSFVSDLNQYFFWMLVEITYHE